MKNRHVLFHMKTTFSLGRRQWEHTVHALKQGWYQRGRAGKIKAPNTEACHLLYPIITAQLAVHHEYLLGVIIYVPFCFLNGCNELHPSIRSELLPHSEVGIFTGKKKLCRTTFVKWHNDAKCSVRECACFPRGCTWLYCVLIGCSSAPHGLSQCLLLKLTHSKRTVHIQSLLMSVYALIPVRMLPLHKDDRGWGGKPLHTPIHYNSSLHIDFLYAWICRERST